MDDFEKFYKAAIRYLSFRSRSEKEMRDYLKRKTENLKPKIDEDIAERIVQSLKGDKFLNDEEFAKMWIRERTLIKPKAVRVIKIELKQKGISDEIIDFVMTNDEGLMINDLESAMKLAEKKLRTIHDQSDKFKVKEKLGRYLASKGFDWDTIKAAIDQSLAK
jgi:regulatory protein